MSLETIHGETVESQTNVRESFRKPVPVDALPPEILAEIFVHSVGNWGVWISTVGGSIMPIAEVCSLWRVIALSEPRLWEKVKVDGRLSSQRLRLLHTILSSRGGEGIVTLEISPICSREWEAIQDLLLSYPFRLRKLHFIDSSFILPHFQVATETFRHVEKISISFFDAQVTDQQELRVFESCPRLRRVSLISRAFGDTIFSCWPFRVILPWGQLEHLTLLSTSIPILANILRLCPRLVSCKAIFTGSRGEPSPPFPPQFEMPRLDLLYLEQRFDYKGHYIYQLLDLLTVPALKSMIISCKMDPWISDEIISMINRSECLIEYFSWSLAIIPGDILIALWRAMPQLYHCYARLESPMTDSMFEEISRENLVPRLKILGVWRVESTSLESLKRFLEGRWGKSSSGIYEGLGDVTLLCGCQPGDWMATHEALLYLNHHGRTVVITQF